MGCFKDELCGVPMKQFYSLNPKVYAFQTTEIDKLDRSVFKDNDEYNDMKRLEYNRKAKGVFKITVKQIKKSDYKYVLDTGNCINKDVHAIRSMNHKVYTIKPTKTCLSPWYDKMKVIHNMNCEPFGYKSNEI